MTRILFPTLAIVLTSTVATPQGRLLDGEGRFAVAVTGTSADPRLSIHAREASIEAILGVVAKKLERELIGVDEIGATRPVSVYLEDRPAKDVLRWTLGCAGLRATVTQNAIVVIDDVSPFPTRDELLTLANVRLMRALIDYPDYAEADRAKMARCRVAEMRGDLASAVQLYDDLIGDHPESDLIPDAMLRSGHHLGAVGQWQDAVRRFDELATLDRSHPYHASARLEMARALCEVGKDEPDSNVRHDNAQKALYVLDALDSNYPTREPSQRKARLLVRSRALSLTADPIRALKVLDLARTYSTSVDQDPEQMELRALALGRAGRHGRASVAWLEYAGQLTGDERAAAFAASAEEALKGGHEVATLFITEMAENDGFGAAVVSHAATARLRLGLETPRVRTLTDLEELERAEAFYAQGRGALAINALQGLFSRRDRLGPDDRLRLIQTYAKALGAAGRTDDAIGMLRIAVDGFDKAPPRRAIYRLASDLFEAAGRYTEAIDAIQGRL